MSRGNIFASRYKLELGNVENLTLIVRAVFENAPWRAINFI